MWKPARFWVLQIQKLLQCIYYCKNATAVVLTNLNLHFEILYMNTLKIAFWSKMTKSQ